MTQSNQIFYVVIVRIMYEDDDNLPKKESYESLKNTVIYYTHVGESLILIYCRNCHIPKESECSVSYGTVLCSPSIF